MKRIIQINNVQIYITGNTEKYPAVLRAYVIDSDTGRRLTTTTCSITVPHALDLETKMRGLANKAAAGWKRKNRTAEKQNEMIPSASIVMAVFNQLNFNDLYFTQQWGAESTRRKAKVYFQRHIIPFIEKHLEEGCTRTDVEDLYDQLLEKINRSGNSDHDISRVKCTANVHMSDARYIYAAMRDIDHDLPEIDFSGFSNGRRIQAEMAKSLPEPVREKLVKYLEDHVKSDPREVLSTVLMFDAALRTAEAAVCHRVKITFSDLFGVACVRSQEKDGKIVDILKTDAAYRNTILSFWGITVIQECIEMLGDVEKTPVLSARELRTWIRQALIECGLGDAFFQAARKLIDEEPEYRSDGTRDTDIIAYILRKDRTSRWLNICGMPCMIVDYMLGHEIKKPVAQKPNLKTITSAQKYAALNENYVYNPRISAHPYFRETVMRDGDDKMLEPALAATFRYGGSGNGQVKIDVETREGGDVVVVRVPKGIKPVVQKNVLPRTTPRDQPIIGSQPKKYIENFPKEE